MPKALAASDRYYVIFNKDGYMDPAIFNEYNSIEVITNWSDASMSCDKAMSRKCVAYAGSNVYLVKNITEEFKCICTLKYNIGI